MYIRSSSFKNSKFFINYDNEEDKNIVNLKKYIKKEEIKKYHKKNNENDDITNEENYYNVYDCYIIITNTESEKDEYYIERLNIIKNILSNKELTGLDEDIVNLSIKHEAKQDFTVNDVITIEESDLRHFNYKDFIASLRNNKDPLDCMYNIRNVLSNNKDDDAVVDYFCFFRPYGHDDDCHTGEVKRTVKLIDIVDKIIDVFKKHETLKKNDKGEYFSCSCCC